MGTAPPAEITILGQRITLKASEQNQESVREVLDLVMSRIRVAEGRLKKNAAPHQVAVLALLDLAEQYIEAKNKTEAFKVRMSEKSGRLICLLEAELRAADSPSLGSDRRGIRANLPRELGPSFLFEEDGDASSESSWPVEPAPPK